ncbi:unnamed protein product, partial [Mesorhabditis spiculigera]
MDEAENVANPKPQSSLAAKKRELLAGLLPPSRLQNADNDCEIDLSRPEDYRQIRFPEKLRLPKKSITSPPTKKGVSYDALEHALEERLAAKRRAGQAKRAELYRQDNAELFESDDEEDDEEEEDDQKYEEQRKKIRETILQRAGDEDEELDDESYHGDEEGESGSENEDEEQNEDSSDEECVSPINKSFYGAENKICTQEEEASQGTSQTVEVQETIATPQLPVPQTLSQWFREDSPTRSPPKQIIPLAPAPYVKPDLTAVNSQWMDDPDLLALCSGRFDTQESDSAGAEDPEDADDVVFSTQAKKIRNGINSDDEEQEEATASTSPKDLETERPASPERVGAEEALIDRDSDEVTMPSQRKRAVLAEELEDEDEEDHGEEEADQFEEEDEEQEMENEAERPETPPGSEIDSDDELALFQRAEHRRQLKKAGFVDEQAELSGSDVGSEDEDEDREADEYEKDAADDEAIDMDEVENQNLRLYQKQRLDEDRSKMRLLQEQLLPDGDLDVPETNRGFRFALRDDEENIPAFQMEENMEEDDDEAEAEKAAESRTNVLRFQLEHQSEEVVIKKPGDALSDAFNSVESLLGKKIKKAPVPKMTMLGLNHSLNKESSNLTSKALYVSSKPGNVAKRPPPTTLSAPKRAKLLLSDALNNAQELP